MIGAHRTVAIAAALLLTAAAAADASAEGTSVHAGATHKYTEHPKEKPTSGKALRADVRIHPACAALRLARLPSVLG